MTEPTRLTAEQQHLLDKHLAGPGHNQGPELVAHADEIMANVAKHPQLSKDAARIRVMFDMLRSHIAGEHLLPTDTARYLALGILLVAGITTAGIAVTPVAALLLDAPVVATVLASLAGEMEAYVDWRAARDPSYVPVKKELYPTA